jgi:hypothetical protein
MVPNLSISSYFKITTLFDPLALLTQPVSPPPSSFIATLDTIKQNFHTYSLQDHKPKSITESGLIVLY